MRQSLSNQQSAERLGIWTEASTNRPVMAPKQRVVDDVEADDCVSVDSDASELSPDLDRLLLHAHAVDPNEFGDIDVLEMLFYLGSRGHKCREVAKTALETCGSLGRVLHARAGKLREIPDVDPMMVSALSVVTFTMKRALAEKIPSFVAIGSLCELEEYLALDTTIIEESDIRILFLDRKNNLIRDERYACAGVRELSFLKQRVAHHAAIVRASGAIMVSSKASSDLQPSRADVEVTIGMRDTLQSLGVTLHDHVIRGHNQCLSMKREALI